MGAVARPRGVDLPGLTQGGDAAPALSRPSGRGSFGSLTALRTAGALREMYRSGPALLLAGRAIQLCNGLLLSIILVRYFGLEVVGAFAIGIAAANVLANVCPLGLHAYLPRVKQSHGQSCFAGLVLFLVQLPAVLGVLVLYAWTMAHGAQEQRIIFLAAFSGYFIGLANLGMMLSIMTRRFYPGFLAPLCETAGLLAGSLLARTPDGLAVSLLLSRIVSAFVIWMGFRLERVAPDRVTEIAGSGMRYLTPDVLALLSEQCAPLLLAHFVSRSELGIFRLCQQLLMAADSPGWTFVQSKYPQMVEGGAEFVDEVHRQVRRIGLTASVLCLLGSAFLALWFFHTPVVALLMTMLSASLVWRYENYLFGQALRAAGRVRVLTALGFAKLLGALVIFYLATDAAGLWGAVPALALLSVVSGVTYQHVYRRPVIAGC
jgi:O-antigen/teichoic acid export membrane protein